MVDSCKHMLKVGRTRPNFTGSRLRTVKVALLMFFCIVPLFISMLILCSRDYVFKAKTAGL